MATDPKTLAYRKEHDLCPRDGRPLVPGRKLCEYCLKKAAEKSARHRNKKLETGLCLSCGRKVENARLCDKCKKSVAISAHKSHVKRYYHRKKTGKCTLCNNDAVDGKTACQVCLDKRTAAQRAKYNINSAKRKCIHCNADLGDLTGKRCQSCIDKRNAWYQGSTTQKNDKARREKNRIDVIKHYGGKCVCCGESELCFLAIDHIDGDGNAHRKDINKYGSTFFKWLVDNNFPEGFQVLCHNCNIGKHLNGGMCPHQDSTIKTRYVYKGRGRPRRIDLDDE